MNDCFFELKKFFNINLCSPPTLFDVINSLYFIKSYKSKKYSMKIFKLISYALGNIILFL